MYRLNCKLPDSVGDKLAEIASKNGQTKVAVIQLAIEQYYQTEQIKEAFIAKMKDDPAVIQQMFGSFLAIKKEDGEASSN